jgi:hypothetical protein
MLEKFGHATLDMEGVRHQYGYPSMVPEWQLPQPQATLNSLYQSNEFYQTVAPLPDAVSQVQRLHALAPIYCYITSRMTHLENMTAAWLTQHGFPAARLICRPPEVTAHDWKIRHLIEDQSPILGIIDNELYVPNDVEPAFHLFELVEYQKITPNHPALEVCANWESIIQRVTDIVTA